MGSPHVLVFLNEASSTSIPLEIAAATHAETSAEVVVASFFDENPSDFDPDVKELNVHIEPLGADSRIDPTAFRRLRKIAGSNSVEVLHTHHNSTGSLARLVFASSNIPIVNTEHNDHRFFSTLQKTTNAVTFPLTDVIVSNSEHTEKSFNWYERLLGRRSQFQTVYNGIDLDRIEDAQSQEIPVELPDSPFVITVGRLVDQKNNECLLRGFAELDRLGTDAKLVVVGEGPRREALETLAIELGIHQSVTFTGYLPKRESVYRILREASVFTVPSNYEGFCVAAVEAMAAGLPVVASDIGVLHEVIGDCGRFFDPDDPNALATELADLLANEERRNELGEQARERARSQFPIQKTAQEYCKIYKRLAKQNE